MTLIDAIKKEILFTYKGTRCMFWSDLKKQWVVRKPIDGKMVTIFMSEDEEKAVEWLLKKQKVGTQIEVGAIQTI